MATLRDAYALKRFEPKDNPLARFHQGYLILRIGLTGLASVASYRGDRQAVNKL
jgi:hypothetical protein